MNSPPRTSVVLDLDGTLVDSEPNYFRASRRLLAGYGVADFTWEEHTRFIGIGTRETLAVLRERYGIGAPLDAMLTEINRLYLELAGASTEVFPEMRKLVEWLHTEGTPMAVASGSSRAAVDAVLEDAPAGAAAAHAAGMRCIAVPYVRAAGSDPAFATAGLVFPGGQSEFTARAAYDWLGPR